MTNKLIIPDKIMALKRKIVLFKSQSDDYDQSFEDSDYEIVYIEPLQFVFVNEDELNQKLSHTEYDGLILTSPRAIEAVSRIWNTEKTVLWSTKKIYTLGDVSGQKIKNLLNLQPGGMSAGNAENLANVIKNENTAAKFLFPCGNLRSETIITVLENKNMIVDSVTVYDTQESDRLRVNLIDLCNSDSYPCGLVFFSPSGCEYVHRQLQTIINSKLRTLPHFAIGNSTAHKIENLGIEISGVASKPKAENVLETVNKYFLELNKQD